MINSPVFLISISVLMDIAINVEKTQKPQRLRDVSPRVERCLSYMEQVAAKLIKSGILDSRRGKGGGYFLSKPAEEITLADLREALQIKHRSGVMCEPLIAKLRVFEEEITLRQLMDEYLENEGKEI